jgi:hypothetical protein
VLAARHSAPSVSEEPGKVGALVESLESVRYDRARAARLIAEAKGMAQSTTSGSFRVRELATVAEALAATDPDRAERSAQSIPGKAPKASALTVVAGALAATDPDGAARLRADAESIAANGWKSPAASSATRAPPRTRRAGPEIPGMAATSSV